MRLQGHTRQNKSHVDPYIIQDLLDRADDREPGDAQRVRSQVIRSLKERRPTGYFDNSGSPLVIGVALTSH